MASWATRRKLFYVTVIAFIAILVVGIPAFFILYQAPSCEDGKLNQGEKGVDCGGPCSLVCSDHFLPAKVLWSRSNYIAPGVYNLAAYIVNPNNDGAAYRTPYKFSLYDSKGIFITERKGVVDIPPHKNIIAFEATVETKQRVPTRTVFEWIEAPEWQETSTNVEDRIDVGDVNLTQDDDGMSLTAILTNPTIMIYEDITVYAVLYDQKGNTLAFSRTVIDSLNSEQTGNASFTWPERASSTIATKEIITVVGKVIDPRTIRR